MPVTNCQITRRGREFNHELAKFVGITQQTLEICSLIARHARTHTRLQETSCNRELTAAELLQEKHIEARITALVAELTRGHSEGKAIRVRFDGDPRGYTVRLVVPDDKHGGNTWGRDGEYGV